MTCWVRERCLIPCIANPRSVWHPPTASTKRWPSASRSISLVYTCRALIPPASSTLACRIPTDATPTPRELVVFINELIALHIERQGDMPLPTLAAYILSRGEMRARGYQIPLNVQQVYSTPTLDKDFTTLYLHADKSQDALYLLIMPDLERALERGDPKELKDVLARSLAALDILDQ